MKTVKYSLFLFLLAISGLFIQCSSNDDSSNEELACNNPSGDILTARVDGKTFCSVGVIIIPTGFEAIGSNSYMLQGMNQNQELLIITITNAPGTYQIPEGAAGGFTPDAVGAINYITHEESPATGTLIIEEITDERVKGSFEFTAFRQDAETGELSNESVTVTNGSFDVALPVD